jgi:hypothetical protein
MLGQPPPQAAPSEIRLRQGKSWICGWRHQMLIRCHAGEGACERNVIAGKRDYAVNGGDHAVNGLALRRGSLLISIPFYGEQRFLPWLATGWAAALDDL